jgi:phosphate transport system ATP-binding protein
MNIETKENTEPEETVTPEPQHSEEGTLETELVFDISELNVSYGDFKAVKDVEFSVPRNQITAMIGPSGCGKSTVLRCLNRMNDLIETAKVTGEVKFRGINLYDSQVDPVAVRRRIGMVFQKPNPFPKTIYDNVAFGPRVGGMKKRIRRGC